MNYSYSDVIPQNLQDKLLALRDDISRNFWSIGDIGIMVCNYVDDNEMYVSRDFIWSAIGSYAGLAARTVREYYRVAKFFKQETRDKYEVLSFSHFMFASRFPDYWEEVLEYAVSETDKLGRPATIDKLDVVFTFGKIIEDDKTYNYNPPDEIKQTIDQLTYGLSEDEQPRCTIVRYVKNMRVEVERLSISQEYREEISDHLDAIERLLQLVTVYIS